MKKELLLAGVFTLGTILGYSQVENSRENTSADLSKILQDAPLQFNGPKETSNNSFLAKMPETHDIISNKNYFAIKFSKEDKDTLYKTFTNPSYSKMNSFEKIKQKILGSRLETYLEYACEHGGETQNAGKMVNNTKSDIELTGIVFSEINEENKKYFEGNLNHLDLYKSQEMMFIEYLNKKGERKQFPFIFSDPAELKNLIEEIKKIRKN